MRLLDLQDLSRQLDELPTGTRVLVTVHGETLQCVACPGGLYLPGDLSVSSADVAEGCPTRVEVVEGWPFTEERAREQATFAGFLLSSAAGARVRGGWLFGHGDVPPVVGSAILVKDDGSVVVVGSNPEEMRALDPESWPDT